MKELQLREVGEGGERREVSGGRRKEEGGGRGCKGGEWKGREERGGEGSKEVWIEKRGRVEERAGREGKEEM